MKQFEQHPLYKKILQEEISRAKQLMFEYNEKEIWNTLTMTQREDALLAVDGDMVLIELIFEDINKMIM